MAITINGSGTISGISAGGLPDGSVTAADLASGAITSGALPSGSVLQVVSTTKTDTGSFSISANSLTNYSGLSVSITPTSTSSKILVFTDINFESSHVDSHEIGISIFRNSSTPVASPDSPDQRNGFMKQLSTGFFGSDANSTMDSATVHYLDSPNTTSATTYSVAFRMANASTIYINRTVQDLNTANRERAVSTITAMEIAG